MSEKFRFQRNDANLSKNSVPSVSEPRIVHPFPIRKSKDDDSDIDVANIDVLI